VKLVAFGLSRPAAQLTHYRLSQYEVERPLRLTAAGAL